MKSLVEESYSIADLCRKLEIRPCGGNYKTLHFYIKEYNLDTSHFTGRGWRSGAKMPVRKPKDLNDILVENSYYSSNKLRIRLIKDGFKKHRCEICNLENWNGQKIPLELDHINGNNMDNRVENLRVICPNCHAQTNSYRGKNSKSKLNEFRKNRAKSFEMVGVDAIKGGEPKKTKESRVPAKNCPNCGVCFRSGRKKYCSNSCYRQFASSNIPKLLDVLDAFKKYKSFLRVGEFFNVTDNTVRKWCKKYNILDLVSLKK